MTCTGDSGADTSSWTSTPTCRKILWQVNTGAEYCELHWEGATQCISDGRNVAYTNGEDCTFELVAHADVVATEWHVEGNNDYIQIDETGNDTWDLQRDSSQQWSLDANVSPNGEYTEGAKFRWHTPAAASDIRVKDDGSGRVEVLNGTASGAPCATTISECQMPTWRAACLA
jgi:hypothetical protein